LPIIPQWYDDDKTVYLLHFTPGNVLDWDEYRQAIASAIADVRTVQHPVIIYLDSDETPMPPGNPLPHVRYALNSAPDNVVAVVNIVNNRFVASILGWLTKIGPYDWLHIVRSKEEAETLIARIQSMHFEKNNAHPAD
jgi:hypothetical protein